MSKTGIFAVVLGIIAIIVCLVMFVKKSEAPTPIPTNEVVIEETITPTEENE